MQLSAEQAGPEVAAALQRGDYASAVALTERTRLPRAELDLAAGQLLLDSLVDEGAITHPAGGVEDGIRRIEGAALAGHADAASALRALFHTGLSSRGKNVRLEPDAALEACWQSVEAGTAKATLCVAQRRSRGP